MKRMNKVGKWKAIAIDWHVTLVYNTQEWCERTRPLWRASLPSRFFYLTQWLRSTEKVEFYRWNNRFAEQVQDLHSLFDHFFCVHCLVSKTLDKLNISRNSTGKEQVKKKQIKKSRQLTEHRSYAIFNGKYYWCRVHVWAHSQKPHADDKAFSDTRKLLLISVFNCMCVLFHVFEHTANV